jgi:GntR family transcriptional regulator
MGAGAVQKPNEPGEAGRRELGSSETTSLPIYHQLYVILRQQIKDGAFDSKVPLPPELTLCKTFNVSRVTVRRALQMLEREQLIVRRHGVGTFAAPEAARGVQPVRIAGLIENLITLGLETTAELLLFDPEAPLPAPVAAALNAKTGEPGLRIERIRRYKALPLSLTNVYLPSRIAPLVTREAIDDRPIVRILEAQGLRALRAEQTISAVAADDDAAKKLSVSIGAPLIRLRRTVFDQDGIPFEYQQGLYNPDQYEYHMLLTRDNSSNRPQWRHIG